ncbi:hypothetical protein Tco_1391184 [Tanacetum coccineum]
MTMSKLPSLIGIRSILKDWFNKRTVSSIPTVLSWSGSIRPEGFLSSVLLWLVIIVAIVGVSVTVVVVIIVVAVAVVEKAVTFLSILRAPMKASRSFGFGNHVRHRTDNFLESSNEGLRIISIYLVRFQVDLIGLIYSHRLGVCIPPGQGIIRVPVGPVFLLGLLVPAIVAACASLSRRSSDTVSN